MRYFLFADPHGHYKELKASLLAAGYDKENKNHRLIGLGDYFDRGSENDLMAEFLIKAIKENKGTFILGNHDCYLLEFLVENDNGYFNSLYNGLDITLRQLSGLKTSKDLLVQGHSKDKIVKAINTKYPDLIPTLKSLVDIVEIDDYIITHGGFKNYLVFDPNGWAVCNYGRTDTFVRDFEKATIYDREKIYVFGHWSSFLLRNTFQNEPKEITPEPFYYKNFVGLDATTVMTKKFNIFIIETGEKEKIK